MEGETVRADDLQALLLSYNMQSSENGQNGWRTKNAANKVSPMDRMKTRVAMIRVPSNMFFTCLNGPTRNMVLYDGDMKCRIQERG